jgi:cytochrome P450
MIGENTQEVKRGGANLPPGPKGYPLLGVAPKIGNDLLGFFLQAAKDYGGIVTLPLGPRRLYLVTQPDYLKQILQDNNRNYAKGYEQVKPLFGEGLLTSDGETWLRQRRLIQPAFHQQQLASFADTMVDFTLQMLEKWQPHSTSGQPLDVAAEMMGLTQRIILKTMFSADANADLDTISRAFDIALNHFNMSMFSPLSQWTWLPTEANRRYHWALRTLDAAVYGMINDRRTQQRDENDLLSMLMNARDAGDGKGMSDHQIRDEIMTIFLAGHETTATTLSWAWYLIGQHPDVEAQLHVEHATVLGGRTPTVADVPRLVYTRMIIDEALRLYPPAWMFARRLINSDTIGGYEVPAGSTLMLSPYVTHHLPSLWIEPERFDPERFRPNTEANTARPRFAYMPFSGGPRICIGNNFALMEAQLIMATVAQRYKLKLAADHTVEPLARATLRPKSGVWVTLSPHNNPHYA